ncbi:hypothetical protein [Thermococcus sp.]
MSGVKKLLALAVVLLMLLYFYSPSQVTQGDIVLKEVQGIIKADQAIRNLSFKQEPRIIVITKAQAVQMWKASNPDLNAIRMKEAIYKMTLLVPENYSLIKTKEEQAAGWIAATMGDRIYIIRENFLGSPAVAERTIAHELVHVLQRQWFHAPYNGQTLDQTLAIRALVEGDADLVADLFCERRGIPIYKIRSLYTRDPVIDMGIFPYVFGDPFVRYLYERGGWGLVNRAYRNLPDSAIEIMEPELYLQDFRPANITLKLPEGFTLIHEDRMGAFYVYLLFWSHGYDNRTAMEISSAWRGDRLILARNSTHELLLWKVLFSDKNAAGKFYELLLRLSRDNRYAEISVSLGGDYVFLKAVRRIENA